MTASSNFGNMFSVMAASAFLPFLPMMPIHLLIQNLLYDFSQTTIPFDRMDADYLRTPRKWDASDLSRFMIFIGPISSVFDILTYLVMWKVFGCNSPEHQALFPVRLVHRRPSLADADRTHDPHAEDSFHPEQSFLAGHRTDRPDHGHRYPPALHPPGQLHRTDRSSAELLPVAGRNPYLLLRTDPSDQKTGISADL